MQTFRVFKPAEYISDTVLEFSAVPMSTIFAESEEPENAAEYLKPLNITYGPPYSKILKFQPYGYIFAIKNEKTIDLVNWITWGKEHAVTYIRTAVLRPRYQVRKCWPGVIRVYNSSEKILVNVYDFYDEIEVL